MTPEQQQIAIAEACGWTHHTIDDHTYWWHEENNKTLPPDDDGMRSCPDYLNDLNAMHEAEKVLRPILSERYYRRLREQIGSYDLAISATAAQRAEAFLRTLNLWTA